MKTFADVYGGAPQANADAPGRVNLLGEHTDYNDGFVLPTAIPQRTRVAVAKNGKAFSNVDAVQFDEAAQFSQDQPPANHFAEYVYGCAMELQKLGTSVPALDIYFDSTVPIGVGLSSSAALEVATLRAYNELLNLELDDIAIARIAQQAEINYAGVICGILDQIASSLGRTGSMLFLDTRTLERRILALPAGSEILVIHSGVSRSLADTGYNQRRAECFEAARSLGVATLRDANLAMISRLPAVLQRRARHVITENDRVLAAISGITAAQFGKLMNESHRSLDADYEVSTRDVNRLVALLQQDSDVFGAKMTGGGFGGACVALCRRARARDIAERVIDRYSTAHLHGSLLVPC
jgi:galactokinase